MTKKIKFTRAIGLVRLELISLINNSMFRHNNTSQDKFFLYDYLDKREITKFKIILYPIKGFPRANSSINLYNSSLNFSNRLLSTLILPKRGTCALVL